MTHPLQTKAWEEFRKSWGNEVVRVDGNLMTLHKIPFLNKKIGIFEESLSYRKHERLRCPRIYEILPRLWFVKGESYLPSDILNVVVEIIFFFVFGFKS